MKAHNSQQSTHKARTYLRQLEPNLLVGVFGSGMALDHWLLQAHAPRSAEPLHELRPGDLLHAAGGVSSPEAAEEEAVAIAAAVAMTGTMAVSAMCLPCVVHVSFMCMPCVLHVHATCIPCVFHVYSMGPCIIPCVFRVHPMRIPCVCNVHMRTTVPLMT